MSAPADAATPSVQREALHFLPLGGAGEIGMNLNLYACQGQWLMVDLGITFAGDTLPGIDVLMPDPAFIEERRKDLLAIVLTHAHEDHLGAVAYLWPRLRCPVYATPFAAAVLREKLADAKLLSEVPLTEVALSSRLDLGPFALTFISLTHSIPEPNALLIETPYGRVMHTGDWKIDPDPLVGDPLDEAALRQAGEAGVLALVGDSTNATVEGESGSEGEVRDTLAELIAEREHGLAVTLFASNVARLESVALAARDAGREPVLVGRSLHRYVRAARACGYLEGVRLLTEDEGAPLHSSQVVYLCTGCQGEPRAAMSRIAGDSHPRVSLGEGDTVIFSSKIIPGNERTIGDLHNRLLRRGIEVITEMDAGVHVSGHPCRGELRQMYQWIRPQIAVPGARRGAPHAGPRRAGPRAAGAGAGLRGERRPAAARTGAGHGDRPRTGWAARAGRRADRRDQSRLDRRATQADAQWGGLRLGRGRPQRAHPGLAPGLGPGHPGRGGRTARAGGDCGGRGGRGGLAAAGAGPRGERDRAGGAASHPARAAREPRQAPGDRRADRAGAGLSGAGP